MSNVNSYTSANQMPIKLLQDKHCIENSVIKPVHIQLIPTNRCNGNCPWCSCKGVDRTLELSLDKITKILHYFKELGTKAVTITGGGEPTIHPHIDNIMMICKRLDIDVGLVTNGILWGKERLPLKVANAVLTWARVSITDTIGDYPISRLMQVCSNLPLVDLGVSFTVTKDVNLQTAKNVCSIANEMHNITHIRFVQDILSPDKKSMDSIVATCSDCPKAIFQYRDASNKGVKNCLISLLKPVINADEYIYPCCGVQYANKKHLRLMPDAFKMCHWSEYKGINAFDGSICDTCYYAAYNETLDLLTTPVKHKSFI